MYLSVYKPAQCTREKPCPVMQWFYGGGWKIGGNDEVRCHSCTDDDRLLWGFCLSASELPALPCGFALSLVVSVLLSCLHCHVGLLWVFCLSVSELPALPDFGTSVGRGLIVVVLGMRDHF
jgi:hypothetical protein